MKPMTLSSVSPAEAAMWKGGTESVADAWRERAEAVQENCKYFYAMDVMTNAKLEF